MITIHRLIIFSDPIVEKAYYIRHQNNNVNTRKNFQKNSEGRSI